jgi:hypothetical protein
MSVSVLSARGALTASGVCVHEETARSTYAELCVFCSRTFNKLVVVVHTCLHSHVHVHAHVDET